MFKLKYLNVHNPAENYWMSHNAKLVEDVNSPGSKLEQICASIQQLMGETAVERYDASYVPRVLSQGSYQPFE